MAQESEKAEKVKIELEVPKDQINIEAVKDSEESPQTTSGYEPGDILKSPLETPHITSAKKPNYTQRVVVVIGFALVAAGFLTWPLISLTAGLAIAFAGALLVALGTLIRL